MSELNEWDPEGDGDDVSSDAVPKATEAEGLYDDEASDCFAAMCFLGAAVFLALGVATAPEVKKVDLKPATQEITCSHRDGASPVQPKMGVERTLSGIDCK